MANDNFPKVIHTYEDYKLYKIDEQFAQCKDYPSYMPQNDLWCLEFFAADTMRKCGITETLDECEERTHVSQGELYLNYGDGYELPNGFIVRAVFMSDYDCPVIEVWDYELSDYAHYKAGN